MMNAMSHRRADCHTSFRLVFQRRVFTSPLYITRVLAAVPAHNAIYSERGGAAAGGGSSPQYRFEG